MSFKNSERFMREISVKKETSVKEIVAKNEELGKK